MRLREWRWRLFSEAQLRRWVERRIDFAASKWCFILGVNNSGTTLLLDMLYRHPELGGLRGEGQQLTSAFPRPSKLGVQLMWTEREDVLRWTERDDPAPVLRALYDWSYYLAPGRYYVEKSPPNTIRSRWLQACFPNSSFIALVRSPYAACEGMRRRRGYEIARAARHWARANEIMLQDWPHLDRKLLITYENLCENCEDELARIRDFLGLQISFGAEIIEAEFRIQNAESKPLKLQNMNTRSLARLTADDIRIIDDIAGPVMEQFGYSTAAAVTS